MSIDEMTGVQALERAAPSLPMQPGQSRAARVRIHPPRHQSLIAAFESPPARCAAASANTRTEAGLRPFLEELFATGATDHALARGRRQPQYPSSPKASSGWSPTCATSTTTSARRASPACSPRWPRAKRSCATPATGSAFTSRPNMPPGSTRSRSGSRSWPASCCGAPASRRRNT